MADEREWVPVAVLWDEDARPKRQDTERLWADIGIDPIEWPPMAEEEQEGDQLSRRRRKKLRGDARGRER